MASKPQTLEQALAHIAIGKIVERDLATLKGKLDKLLVEVATGRTNLSDVAGLEKIESDTIVFYTVDFPEFFGAVHPKGLRAEQWREHARQVAAFVTYVFTQAKLEDRNYSRCNWIEVPRHVAGILPIENELTQFDYGIRAQNSSK